MLSAVLLERRGDRLQAGPVGLHGRGREAGGDERANGKTDGNQRKQHQRGLEPAHDLALVTGGVRITAGLPGVETGDSREMLHFSRPFRYVVTFDLRPFTAGLQKEFPTMEAFQYRGNELFCEEVPVTRLAEQYGTPLWIYSRAKFLHEFNAIRDAFAALDPVICYSVKSNSNINLLKLLGDAGSSFDVVSGGELFRVQQSGADTTKVIFAGVGKTDDEIRYALEADILMFNVESEPELDAISAVAKSMNRVARVALRLNPDIDAKTHSKTTTGKKGNKFGMDIERHNALAAKVLKDPHLELRGIHMHLGSPFLRPTRTKKRRGRPWRSSLNSGSRDTRQTGSTSEGALA